jgi:hypothetical protein
MGHLSTVRKYFVLFWTDRDGKVTKLKCRVKVKAEQVKLFGIAALAVLLSLNSSASVSKDARPQQTTTTQTAN